MPPARSAMHAVASPDTAISNAPAKNALANNGSSAAPTPEATNTIAGSALDDQREGSGKPRVLPRADPVDARRLDRPECGRPAIVERERNGDGREDDGQHEECARQQRETGFAAPAQGQEEQRIDDRQRERAPRRTVLEFAHQRGLRCEPGQRHAEHEETVHRIACGERPAPRVKNRDGDVEDEEQRQERLHGRVMFRPVELATPDEPEHEGEREAHRIEHPPCLRPREREDRGVQQREIAEQQQGAAVVSHQHRGQESAGDGQTRERLRIVAHGEPDRKRRHRDEQHDRRRLGQHAIEAKRRVGRQIEDAGSGTLQ